MRRKQSEKARSRTLIMLLTLVCVVLIAVSILDPAITGPVYTVTGYVIIPVKKGINTLGHWITNVSENLTETATIRAENDNLRSQVETDYFEKLTEEYLLPQERRRALEISLTQSSLRWWRVPWLQTRSHISILL